MIDFHSHILPEIDDGSASVEMSRDMLRMEQEQGVNAVIATPHFYPLLDTPENFLQRRQAAVEALGETPIPVVCGAEVAYFEGISYCEELSQLCIGQTRLLLLEMPIGPWNTRLVDEVVGLPATIGVVPVLAHIDRYRSQVRKWGDELLSKGVLFQCNAAAFVRFGSRRWAMDQLVMDRIHFIGSDCHDITNRPPNMAAAAKVIRDKIGGHPVLEEEI